MWLFPKGVKVIIHQSTKSNVLDKAYARVEVLGLRKLAGKDEPLK